MGLFDIFSPPTSTPPTPAAARPSQPEGDARHTVTDRPPAPEGAPSVPKLPGPAGLPSSPVQRFEATHVLEKRGVSGEQRTRVQRTLELLRSLPEETPEAARRSIVEASLKAFDISISAIVKAADSEIRAFEDFIASGHRSLEELTQSSEARIASLEAEIARLREYLELATTDQAAQVEAAHAEIERVRPILSFFSVAPEDVANDQKSEHPPTIIIDESLTRAG